METTRQSRRSWRIAILVSLLVHAAFAVAVSIMPDRAIVGAVGSAGSGPVGLSLVEEGPGGEVHFIAAAETRDAKKNSKDAEPAFQATLRDPIEVAALGQRTPVGPGEALSSGPPPLGQPSPVSSGQNGNGFGKGATSFFQVEARGGRIVYVVDCSGSMGTGGGWAAARRELLRSIEQLPAEASFQVILYSGKPQLLLPRWDLWLRPTAATLSEVNQALNNRIPEGKTDHGAALQKALTLLPDVIFFLTDADDLRQEQLRQVNLSNRGRAVIHTIELSLAHRERVGMPLQILARDNRGVYQAVDLGERR